MDYRHFELQDILSEALIALEAGRAEAAGAAVRRALAWIEADWLATPSDAPTTTPAAIPLRDDGEDDD